MIELLLGAVACVAVMRVFWESEGTSIAVDTHDPELMENSWSGMLVAFGVAVVAFVGMLLVMAGGAM